MVAKMDRENQTTCQQTCTSAAKKGIDWDKCVVCHKLQLKLANVKELQRGMDGAGENSY